VGLVMKETTLNNGLFTATVFPILMIAGILLQKRKDTISKQDSALFCVFRG
jgi:hypothetical protein